ncbi:MAG: HTH-type transcriptional regulator LutR [Desulfovibrio sp.]
MFEQLRHKRVYEEVIDLILERIRSGALAVGEKLPPERLLAEQLGVSRTSVREALRSLESMGYIRSSTGGGNYVNTVTLDHVLPPLAAMMSQDLQFAIDLIEMRRLLEINMATLAAQKATKEQVSRIYGAILNMEADIEKGGVGIEGDDHFHQEIARASGNKAFVIFTEIFGSLLSESRKATMSIEGQPAKTLQDHMEIFEAIRDRDAARAAASMDAHLDKAYKNLQMKRAQETRNKNA